MYIADSNGNVFKERKAFDSSDFADEHYAINIISINSSAKQFTLTSSANVLVNDVIQQTTGGITYTTQVTEVFSATNTVTVRDVSNFVPGAATNFRSIPTHIVYCPIHGGFSEYVKKWTIWQFFFNKADFNFVTLTMSSDWSIAAEQVNLVPIVSGGWGTQPWGAFPWGVSTIAPQMIPTWPSKNTVYSHWVIIDLALTQAFTSIGLDGVAATFDITSTRGR